MEPPKTQKVESSSIKFWPLVCSPARRCLSQGEIRLRQSNLQTGKAVGKPQRSPSAVSRGTGRDRLPLLLHRPSAFLRRACFQGVQKRLPASDVATPWKQPFFGTTDSSGPAAREEQAEWGCSQERDKQNMTRRDCANRREDRWAHTAWEGWAQWAGKLPSGAHTASHNGQPLRPCDQISKYQLLQIVPLSHLTVTAARLEV